MTSGERNMGDAITLCNDSTTLDLASVERSQTQSTFEKLCISRYEFGLPSNLVSGVLYSDAHYGTRSSGSTLSLEFESRV